MHFLITRPTAAADAPGENRALKDTLSRLQAKGHTGAHDPMLLVHEVDTDPPAGDFRGLLISSSHAVSPAARLWPAHARPALPVLTTGNATMNAARKQGFARARSANGSALDLVAQVPGWMAQCGLGSSDDLLYPCARQTAQDISALLDEQGIRCTPWVVYETLAAQSFLDDTIAALEKGLFDGVLLYSPRTATIFSKLFLALQPKPSVPTLLVFSNAVKNALSPELQQKAIVSNAPDEASLFQLLTRLNDANANHR